MIRRSALVCLVVFVGSIANGDATARGVAAPTRVQYDSQRGVSYAWSHTADGGIRLSGHASGLVFDKTSYADGHFELQLSSGRDSLVFRVSAAGTELRRDGRSLMLSTDAAAESQVDEARALLAGSHAVKRYRQLAATIEISDEASPAADGVLISAAIVHALDGDPGAPARIARRLSARRTAAGLHNVALVQETSSEDCWASYSDRVNQAWKDFEDCQRTRQWYNFELVSYACSGVWMIRVEGYWFQYLKCSALF